MARIWPRTRFSTQPSQDGARHGGRGLPGGGEGAASQESRGQRWTPERGRAAGTGHRVTASRAPRRPPHVTAATVLPSSAPDTVSLSLKCHLSRAGSCCSQGKNTLSVSTFLCRSVPTSVLALTSIFFFFTDIFFNTSLFQLYYGFSSLRGHVLFNFIFPAPSRIPRTKAVLSKHWIEIISERL